MRGLESMLNFHIPDFFLHFNLNISLLKLINDKPYMFYDDFKIGAVFGNFPNCTWNGGSLINGPHLSHKEQTRISNTFNSLGVPLRLTMTNPLIEERDCYDRYANYIMENLNNGFNQVLVSSPILEDYIRTEYPDYPIVRSILSTKDIYYDDSDRYIMSVLRKHKNNDLDLLRKIDNKDKIELLVNEICEESCPRTYSHYEAYAKKQMYEDNKGELPLKCSYNREFIFKKFRESPLCLTREKIKNIYEPMGFKNFKISGRTKDGSVVIFYAHYFVKPDYKDDFISMMLNSIIKDGQDK